MEILPQVHIGVVGFSGKKFDQTMGRGYLVKAFNKIVFMYDFEKGRAHEFIVVSGLTDLGIPALAYREASMRGWRTYGIACEKAKDYPCFPVHKTIISGVNWGDESRCFLQHIDVLIRVGGGPQAFLETTIAKAKGIKVLEYNLEEMK